MSYYAVVSYTILVDETSIQMGEISRRQESHVICEFMAVEEELSSEEQSYYVRSMYTINVVEGDRLFSEHDKLCFSVSVFQQTILAIKSEYVNNSESGM